MRIVIEIPDEEIQRHVGPILHQLAGIERIQEDKRPEAPQRPLTVSEVAKLLGIGRNAVYRLCRSGELRALRIGASIRVTPTALADFVRDLEARGVQEGASVPTHGSYMAR